MEAGLRDLWTWTGTDVAVGDDEDLFDGDGSRSGEKRVVLAEELARTGMRNRGSVL